MPRLVSLDDFRLEAYLDGYLLVFRHHDVPGIIGGVGTIFGRHGVNIAQMAVGRAAPGGEAVGVLNLDSRAVRRGPGRGPAAPGHHVGHGRPPAAGRPVAGLAAGLKPAGCRVVKGGIAVPISARQPGQLPGKVAASADLIRTGRRSTVHRPPRAEIDELRGTQKRKLSADFAAVPKTRCYF